MSVHSSDTLSHCILAPCIINYELVTRGKQHGVNIGAAAEQARIFWQLAALQACTAVCGDLPHSALGACCPPWRECLLAEWKTLVQEGLAAQVSRLVWVQGPVAGPLQVTVALMKACLPACLVVQTLPLLLAWSPWGLLKAQTCAGASRQRAVRPHLWKLLPHKTRVRHCQYTVDGQAASGSKALLKMWKDQYVASKACR